MRDQVLIFGCSTADQLRLTATKAANTRLELALVLMDIKSLAKVALAVSWMVAKSLVVEAHMEIAVLGVYKTCCFFPFKANMFEPVFKFRPPNSQITPYSNTNFKTEQDFAE